MDLKLQRPAAACHETGAAFAPGDVIYSALIRDAGSLSRYDWSVEAWPGPPAETLAWWRNVVPEQPGSGVSLAPVDVLLDTLEALENRPEDAALRYLLALQLVRRRVLRFAEAPPTPGEEERSVETDADTPALQVLALSCRRRDCDYSIPVAVPAAEDCGAVEERLAALLWSGGEA